jgi:hypothetical protein
MLTLSSVHLQCLDRDRQPIAGATASGFIRKEGTSLFLYTCWHVVTGFDPYSKTVPAEPPTRRSYLRLALQAAESTGPEATRIGGVQIHELPLFEQVDDQHLPLWLQDENETPHVELNALGYRVPFWHDAVKLKLPENFQISAIQLVDNQRMFGADGGMVFPGDKALVAGFPHGFSTVGLEQPTPVVLTRFVAGTAIAGRHRQFLLESIGSAGMSGGPVYIEAGSNVLLVGMYTGLIYPDYLHRNPEKATALGTVADLTFHFHGHLPFARPSLPQQEQ